MTEDEASDRKEDTASPASTSLSGPRPLTSKDLPPGLLIDGKYRIESLLGQGGMGVVMAATHLVLREQVALKFLRVDDETGQAGFRSRFRREAQICAKIKNEHITRVIDVGTFQDAEYMVMERLEGTDLRGFLRANKQGISVEEAVALAVQVCDGLAEVHARDIVHRDLKPSNLFIVRRSDGSPLVKILDFGISKWGADLDASEDELTKTGAVLGSPKYMAPEQLFGSHTVDARADVWSVGAITYELLTGRPPFEEPTFARLCARLAAAEPPRRVKELRPEISDELDAAVMLCLERNLAERIPSVAQLAGELLHAVGDPTAEVVRQRMLTILAGGTLTGETNVASLRSGEWVRASLSRTGSNPSATGVSSVSNLRISGTNPAMSAPAQTATVPAPEEQKSKKGLYIALALIALLAVLGITRITSQPAENKGSATPPPTPSAIPTGAPAPSPTPVATVTGAPTPSAAPSAVEPAPTVATKPTAVVAVKKPGTPTPAPTPTATAAPPATTTAKPANPLEDRQ